MKQVIHNPTAGKKHISKEEIMNALKDNGSEIAYISTEEPEWEKSLESGPEIVYVAGGDGTVHKVATAIINRESGTGNPKIHIIPTGTANNMAKSLNIPSGIKSIKNIKGDKFKAIDYGKVKGLSAKHSFESIGMGVFPAFVKEIKRMKKEGEPAGDLKQLIEKLVEKVTEFKPLKVKLKTESFKISGSFLLVEIMNINYLGPNLHFAPSAISNDGFFDLIMVPENRRRELILYLEQLLNGKNGAFDAENFMLKLKLKEARIKCKTNLVQIDDELDESFKNKMEIKVIPKTLNFCY